MALTYYIADPTTDIFWMSTPTIAPDGRTASVNVGFNIKIQTDTKGSVVTQQQTFSFSMALTGTQIMQDICSQVEAWVKANYNS